MFVPPGGFVATTSTITWEKIKKKNNASLVIHNGFLLVSIFYAIALVNFFKNHDDEKSIIYPAFGYDVY